MKRILSICIVLSVLLFSSTSCRQEFHSDSLLWADSMNFFTFESEDVIADMEEQIDTFVEDHRESEESSWYCIKVEHKNGMDTIGFLGSIMGTIEVHEHDTAQLAVEAYMEMLSSRVFSASFVRLGNWIFGGNSICMKILMRYFGYDVPDVIEENTNCVQTIRDNSIKIDFESEIETLEGLGYTVRELIPESEAIEVVYCVLSPDMSRAWYVLKTKAFRVLFNVNMALAEDGCVMAKTKGDWVWMCQSEEAFDAIIEVLS